MAQFPTPSQINTQYLQILKSVKPSLNINDANSDFVIRGKPISGIASGLYGDQAKVNLDTWISTCRDSALVNFGVDYDLPQQPATQSDCPQAQIPGVNGTIIAPGDLTFLYLPTNVLYTNTTGGTIASGTVTLAVQCQITGQIGNIKSPDTLQIVSPPTGVGPTATLLVDMADGSDIESFDSYRARLLNRRQNTPAGGNETDYPNFAFLADPSVRTAVIFRFDRGLGTVGVYITTGTTDIDAAVTNGVAVIRIPSDAVLAAVQAYYNAHVPLTDCPTVYKPTEVDVDVTVNVVYAAGLTGSSIPADSTYNPQSLTCLQLIQREVARALYKTPIGGRIIPGDSTGVVAASDIEEGLDIWLSAVIDIETGFVTGKLPIMADRQVQKLDGANWNLPVLGNQIFAPGTITVVNGV